jgi:dipeptidase E
MRRLYFLGGEDIVKRDSSQINKRAFVDAGGAPFVLVLPWAAESIDKTYSCRKIMTDYFKDLGARTVDFAEYSDSVEEIAEKADRSDLIYIPGGFTRTLVKRMRNKNVDNLLRKYDKVIAGRSAGALALCKECILTRNRGNPETVIITGIRLVDFNVKVHYDPSRDDELKELSKEGKIYGIPERSALIYDDDSLSFIGHVYLFQNGKKTTAN